MGGSLGGAPLVFFSWFCSEEQGWKPLGGAAHPLCVQTSPCLLLLLFLRRCSFCGAQPVPTTQAGRRILSSIFHGAGRKMQGIKRNIVFFLNAECRKKLKIYIYFHGVLEEHSRSWVFSGAPKDVCVWVLFLYYSALTHWRKETVWEGFIFERTFLIFALSSTKIFLKAKRIFIYIYLLNLMIYCDSPFHLFFPWWVCGTPIKINSGFTCTVRGD